MQRNPEDIELRARLAHSLLANGRIEEAAESFACYRDAGGTDRRWVASEFVARSLASAGCGNWASALGRFGLAVPDEDPAHPLPYEARVSLIWFNGGVAADASDDASALLMFLAAVVLFGGDDEAWVQATVHAFNPADPMLFTTLVEAAYQQRGYAYLDQLRQMTTELERPRRAALLDVIDLITAGRAFVEGPPLDA